MDQFDQMIYFYTLKIERKESRINMYQVRVKIMKNSHALRSRKNYTSENAGQV